MSGAVGSTTSEVPYWVPGHVAPYEAVSRDWSDAEVVRWFVHANGRRGEPCVDIWLGAMAGPARVIVTSALREAWPTTEEQREHALMTLLSLPSLVDLTQVKQQSLHETGSRSGAWVTTGIVTNGEMRQATMWTAPSGEWCLLSEEATQVIHIAASGIDHSEVQLRRVSNWTPYGVDLSKPQPATSLQRRTEAVLPAWEAPAEAS